MQRVFNKQSELMEKFGKIEKENGYSFIPDGNIDLDDPKHQLRIKEMIGRIFEELAEASNAFLSTDISEPVEVEMIDALHFLTELTITLGYDWYDMEEHLGDIDNFENLVDLARFATFPQMFMNLITRLGMLSNTLKNRPWKQTLKLTDEVEFDTQLIMVWSIYFDTMIICFGMTSSDIIEAYLEKHQVNIQRIEDGK